ncbi:N-formylglutamate amidohydrolase [Streptomyces sp. SAT1]|uniref:N-formylglutamate amidohydrolase n=1 Tax=Streptomyces sp. SAT1 TaxID=1849967 RepID=UPI0007DDA929|nr:N-formylglutamate amidohydrolase [Streptomyces sp. SAT1]ANH94341.1 N-formylglutamate amidohydrolase [Streptomyces sp. SAT1]
MHSSETSARPSFAYLPGAPDSPVILHVPHSSRVVPADVRRGITLDDAALARELDHITDAHTEEIAAAAAARCAVRPWRFVNRLSRLVTDPERFPDEREEMLSVGMGAVYTRTTHGAPLRPDAYDGRPLVERYFRPYAAAMTDAVAERLAAVGRAVIIDVHSYPTARLPYELHGDGPRPAICLGSDGFHTSAELLGRAERAFAEFAEPGDAPGAADGNGGDRGGLDGRDGLGGRGGGIGIDTPFRGTYVPLRYYGTDRRVAALMIEIRRDVYMSEPGGPADASGVEALGAALARLVDAAGAL